MAATLARSPAWPLILSEDLTAPAEPLGILLRPGPEAAPRAVARLAARALLASRDEPLELPAWLAPHQIPAAQRLNGILEQFGGALLADAVGLGKSYIALALALARREPFTLVVPAVLVDQWRTLLVEKGATAPIITHEALSSRAVRPESPSAARLFLVDEAHRFRNPDTNRYRALAKLVVGARLLLVTATPVHNRLADLFHLFRLFLRDHDLTPLGIASLGQAASGGIAPDLLAGAVARLAVARSRERVRTGYSSERAWAFPERAAGREIRLGTLPQATLERSVRAVERLAHGEAAPLFRLLLLSRLSSSAPAFCHSLDRYAAYLDLAVVAEQQGRALRPRDFQRLFPAPGDDADALQLALFPVLLPAGAGTGAAIRARDLVVLHELRALITSAPDPKASALHELITADRRKTVVFTAALATARYLARGFANQRVAAVFGPGGMLGSAKATRGDVLRAFAPAAQSAPAPPAALRTDLLIATDLLSEGLNLQDAERVVHYDLPWSPARLAQRVGRIDRLGSTHDTIETVTFLPPPVLARSLRLEERLTVKAGIQARAAATQLETARGPAPARGLDWCDRLERLAAGAGEIAPSSSVAAIEGNASAVVLVIRLGTLVDAVIVERSGARADAARAADHLEAAQAATPLPLDRSLVDGAIERAAALVRGRLAAIADARWRAADRDRLGRRLIPWVLAAARSASRRGDQRQLAKLDGLVSRLSAGMTAGEELLLAELVERKAPLSASDAVAWHERLPPLDPAPDTPQTELVAALVVRPPSPPRGSPAPVSLGA